MKDTPPSLKTQMAKEETMHQTFREGVERAIKSSYHALTSAKHKISNNQLVTENQPSKKFNLMKRMRIPSKIEILGRGRQRIC